MNHAGGIVIRPLAVDTNTAAAMIGRAPKTLVNWRSLGIGPRYVKDEGDKTSVTYRVSDLERWLADRVVDTESVTA